MRRIALAAMAALVAAPAMAQDGTRLPLFEAGIFGGGGWLPDYPAAAQNHARGVVLPFLIYRGELLRSDERGLRGRILRGRDLEFSLSFNGSLRASSRDNRAREGMPDLDYLGEVGPALRWVAWRDGSRRRITLELPFRAVFSTDFSQTHYRGYTFAPELAFEQTGLFFPRARARVGIGPVFGSGRFMDYFYQVRGEFARPGRPAYDAHGGYLGTRLQFSYRVPVTDRISIGGGGRLENFSGATNADSPLFRREFNFTLLGGVSFALYRSEATVASAAEPFD
ncbi:MAG: MipA/OmpV family protein [Acetobacteraceae bacterium]|nr:MipA/OmpV family protein [Acetobacteraceae bacterium]